jgi:hypothetical protein
LGGREGGNTSSRYIDASCKYVIIDPTTSHKTQDLFLEREHLANPQIRS